MKRIARGACLIAALCLGLAAGPLSGPARAEDTGADSHPLDGTAVVNEPALEVDLEAPPAFGVDEAGAQEAQDLDGTNRREMHRLYNRVSREHLYTADLNEVRVLTRGDWTYEGVGWVAPVKSRKPVYRLYSPVLGDHHYTADKNEVRVLTKKHRWRNEGIGWYSADSKAVKIYRQFLPGLAVGSHNYTGDVNEYKTNNSRGWRGEGLAWYALAPGWQAKVITRSISRPDMGMTVARMASLQEPQPFWGYPDPSGFIPLLDTNRYSPIDSAYYQFMDLHGYTGLSAAQIDAFIASTPAGRAGNLGGLGYVFVNAARTYGVNEAYLVSHCILESGWGTSDLAQGYHYNGRTPVGGRYYPAGTYYNYFGIGAVDSSPLSGGRAMAIKNGWNSRERALMGAAEWISRNYINGAGAHGFNQPTFHAFKWDYERSAATGEPGWHQYTTDPNAPAKVAMLIDRLYTDSRHVPTVSFIIPRYR